MPIVEVVPKQNSYQIVSERKLRHDFYVLQKRILFLKLWFYNKCWGQAYRLTPTLVIEPENPICLLFVYTFN